MSLDLRADFGARVLSGTARLSIARTSGGRVVLDTHGLTIESVTAANGDALDYELGPADPIKGRALDVRLPSLPGAGAVAAATLATTEIVVRYRTSPDATALQWLAPAQTAGRAKPYLFSQGQAILTRSWIPTQDSPGIRQTYDARIVVPDGLARGHECGAGDAGGRARRRRPGVSLPPGASRFRPT